MLEKNILKLSEQALGSVMVAFTNALIQVALEDQGKESDPTQMDVSKVLAGYQFVLSEDGTLDVQNPVVAFSLVEPETQPHE